MAETINGIVEMRQDTEANYISNNTVLYEGEMALATDTKVLKVGDGTSTWAQLNPATNIYGIYKNGSLFNASRLGEPVSLGYQSGVGDHVVVESFNTLTSLEGGGFTEPIIGVWAEDGVQPNASGKVLLRGIGQVEVRTAAEAGDRIMQGVAYQPGAKAYNVLMIANSTATVDSTLTLAQPIISSEYQTVDILAGDTPADIVEKIGAVTFSGYNTLVYPNAPHPLMVIFFAQDPEQKFIFTESDAFSLDNADDWFDNATIMGSIGAEEGGAKYETGRVRLSSSTCPSDGTISITLPGESTPITRVCTAGDTRSAVYADLIASAPGTYTLFTASSSGSSLFYRANTAESKSSSLTFDGGDTGWTNTGGDFWQVVGSDPDSNGADIVSPDLDDYCFGTVLETTTEAGYATVLVEGSNTPSNAMSSPYQFESATAVDIWTRSAAIAVEISGTAEITTINKMGCNTLTVLPTGEWTLATGGNIATASTAVVGKPMVLVYGSDFLWHPSY